METFFHLTNIYYSYCLSKKYTRLKYSSFSCLDMQKQPSRGILRKTCSENMQQTYRRTPLPKCDFNKNCKATARVYNRISVPQITRLLLVDATISSKTDLRNASKKEKKSYGKVRNNKTMLKILSLIRILYPKQQYSARFLQFNI